MEGLRRGTVGEPGGRSWSELEVKSGTESLEGVLAMMEGGICRKWEPGGGISRKGSLERTLGLESGKCMGNRTGRGICKGWAFAKSGFGVRLGMGRCSWSGFCGEPRAPRS